MCASTLIFCLKGINKLFVVWIWIAPGSSEVSTRELTGCHSWAG